MDRVGAVFYTYGSSLYDFELVQPIDVSLQRIRDVYGVDVSDVEAALLFRIFARVAATQSHA